MSKEEKEHCHDSTCCSSKAPITEELDFSDKQVMQFRIEGMDCGSCAASLQKHVSQSLGIAAVSVNFSTAKLKIAYTGDATRVLQAIEEAGYKGEAETGSYNLQAPPATSWLQDRAVQSTLFAGLLILVGWGFTYGQMTGMATLFYALAIISAGWKLARSAWFSLRSKSLDMNVLMTAAAIGAAIIGEWLEGAAVVFLFGLGNALQSLSISKTRQSIRSLMNLTPPQANVRRNNEWVSIQVERITVGETIQVSPGDRIPLDGVILKGTSGVNQAPITGESLPVEKQAGDRVYAGSINENGALEVQVEKTVGDSTIARIIHLVEEAQEKKAPTEQFLDRFARVYTPIVIGIAVVIMVIPPFLTGDWSTWFYRGLELLVIACPCALVISTPVAVVSAIGSAARNGVLIKGGAALEAASRFTHVAVDKTGTLTEGKPQVSSIVTIEGISQAELLSIAASAELNSTHPIARTIVSYAKGQGIEIQPANNHQAIVGKGIVAEIGGNRYLVGSNRLFEENGIEVGSLFPHYEEWQQEGKTIVWIGDSKQLMGVITVADVLRPRSREVISQLYEQGITPVMLTGDNQGTAAHISQQVGIKQYAAELLPDQKLQEIERLKKTGVVAMIGDGINDAPALATSDLGISMGGVGSDTAMEAADIVLMGDDLEKVAYIRTLSQKATTIIKQNIWFSLVIKLIALILIVPNWLTLWMAVVSDSGAAMIVIFNSMRLLKK